AKKFCTYLLTYQFNKPIGDAITSLVNNIALCSNRGTSLLQMHISPSSFDALTKYLSSINKGEMQMVERSVQGNWQLFLDELTDDFDIPF
ncbi:hypothetical protein, partial [Dulcicalothrix desertica]